MTSPVSLLHFDGTDAATTFTDESGKTWTARGNAQIDTAQKVFGTASGLFDGTGDWIDTPDHADFDLGSGDFTIDFRVRFTTLAGQQAFCSQDDVGTQRAFNFRWRGPADNTLTLAYTVDGATPVAISVSWSPSIDTWYHVALVRSGSNLYFFVDGTQVGATQTLSATIFDSTAVFAIGSTGGLTHLLTGWIDEFRLKKGQAVWTANFTVPGGAYHMDQTATLGGTITPSGAVVKKTSKALGGTLSFSGLLVALFTRILKLAGQAKAPNDNFEGSAPNTNFTAKAPKDDFGGSA